MITRKIRWQLGAFVVIALLGVSYVGANYVGIDRLFGPRGYVVRVQLAESGGIFRNAEVTYRGVTVGRVGPLRLTDDGVEVQLDIEPSAPEIPDDVRAVVANRSAVGEQYVDLRPNRGGGPFLTDGAVIPQERTSTPLPVQTLLANLDGLASSVPTEELRTVVHELGTAFEGTGPDLQVLLDTTRALTRDAHEHLPQTLRLIDDGRTVLRTQAQQSSALTSFSRDLRTLAEQLRSSDPDLRRLISAAPQASEQLTGLLRESGPGLGRMIANLLTTSDIMRTRTAGLEQVLVTYPLVVGGSFTVLPGDGTAHFGLALNTFDPPPCTRGYEGTRQRPGNDTGPVPLNTGAYCAEPLGSPIVVRGAQNAPYGGRPAQPNATGTSSGNGKEPAQPPLPGLLGLPHQPGPRTFAELLGLLER
ncbi:ABC transporter substrate-binding protein [Longimycelium tulufanense]|uniref:ABC transporter substrate-binding protein n=1 Tax=Longimycelium tulufanense TaxID=907463 RepID=A0A8J3CE04_9PSEU|nr:MCE family protein [Longimycelium tulufanense]GGM52068.1 ABC transporter substrate-binding protein [Longimycelium tulufanense]